MESDAVAIELINDIVWREERQLIGLLCDRLIDLYPHMEWACYQVLIVEKKWPTNLHRKRISSDDVCFIPLGRTSYPWDIHQCYYEKLKRKLDESNTVAIYAYIGEATPQAILTALIDLIEAYHEHHRENQSFAK